MTALTEKTAPITDAAGGGKGSEFYRQPSAGSEQSSSSLHGLKEKASKEIHKICDHAIPVSKSQKRSRYIPGKRYFPLLWIQWLWHPLRVLWSSVMRAKLSDHHHHNHHHHHHQHHHQHQQHHAQIDEDICVLGDGSEGKMDVIINAHELLMD